MHTTHAAHRALHPRCTPRVAFIRRTVIKDNSYGGGQGGISLSSAGGSASLTLSESHLCGNPVGSALHSQDAWRSVSGTRLDPRAPWRYVRTAGCRYGMECPGDKAAGTNRSEGVRGLALHKEQEWLANFPLDEANRVCRASQELLPPEHQHLHVRGSTRVEGGSWMALSEWSGRYTPELSAMYAECLRRALQEVGGPARASKPQLKATELAQLAERMGSGPRPAGRDRCFASGPLPSRRRCAGCTSPGLGGGEPGEGLGPSTGEPRRLQARGAGRQGGPSARKGVQRDCV